ncbi:hypothetical protein GGF37_004523, partial [Kickxella alabastrina]
MKIQKREELLPGETEPSEVCDKRRQRLLKCLGDNIWHNYPFDTFVESLGVKQRYDEFITDWPDLFLDIARGSPVVRSKKVTGITKAKGEHVDIFRNSEDVVGRIPIPDWRLITMDHQSDAIRGTPHKPEIAFYHKYNIQDTDAVHAILEAKIDLHPDEAPEDTRGQLADYSHVLNDKQATRTFAPKVNVESKGDSKIEVLHSVSKDVKDGAALFCIKETIAHYSYMIGRHIHLFRGEFNGLYDAVLKLSWTPVNRLPEGAAYAILNMRPVECIPKVFSSGLLISNLNGYRLEFVLMEYCGQSMAEYLKDKADDQKDELVPGFVEQLTLCLAQANDTGVLHRDISAGNVCIKNDKVY